MLADILSPLVYTCDFDCELGGTPGAIEVALDSETKIASTVAFRLHSHPQGSSRKLKCFFFAVVWHIM